MEPVQAASVPFGRSIVVGVDTKPRAEHVVRMGEELGRRLDLEVHRVHAVPKLPDVWPGLDPAWCDVFSVELLDAARSAVDDRVRPVLEEFHGGTAGRAGSARRAGPAVADVALVDLVQGSPAEVLLAESRRRKAGLLVLGRHEKRPLLEFGNTLRTVYAKSAVPVWMQPVPVAPVRRILAAIDLSEDSLHALGAACALAKAFGAEVRALHCFHVEPLAYAGGIDSGYGVLEFPYPDVIRSERARFETTMERFDWRGVPHATEFVEAPPAEGLLEASRDVDLVVLGTHGRTGLSSVVLGGVAYSVLKRSTKPTLAVPRPGRMFRVGSGS